MTDEMAVEEPVENIDSPEVATSDTDVSSDKPQVEVDEKQKALNKLAFEKREQKRRADTLQAENEQLKASQQAKQPVQDLVMPREFDFDDDSKYQAAMTAYTEQVAGNQVNKSLTEYEERQQKRAAEEKRKAISDNFSKQIAENKIEGYEESVANLPDFQPAVLDAIMMDENGQKLAYHLSQHLDVADRIAMSDPIIAAVELGKISAHIANINRETKISAAPDPIDPINQAGAVAGEKVDPLIEGATFE